MRKAEGRKGIKEWMAEVGAPVWMLRMPAKLTENQESSLRAHQLESFRGTKSTR